MQGKRNKTCIRHSKKRSLEVDDWANFNQVLRNWNKPDQTEILDGKYIFDLDALPVEFGPLRVQENESLRERLNAAMRKLTEIIWTEGKFRFTHTSTNGAGSSYIYHCSQDVMSIKKYESPVEPGKRRDGGGRTRFPCESKLIIGPCLQNRTLSLSIHHKWHEFYDDIRVPPTVQEMIDARVSSKTPSEILHDVRGIPEGKEVARHQVYYQWRKANADL
ncbi:hypothetical protein N7461_005719 [Penicillium sp. DV-2018c]|nr:hypothetical protein N7461_005719 [Penicillium sp. DV-2018c]